MTGPDDQVLAVRQFRDAQKPDVAIELRLFRPRPDEGDWSCRYEVAGLGELISTKAFGIDALQALQIAIESARQTLDERAGGIVWLGGEGESGLYRTIVHGIDAAFGAHLSAVVDAEIERFSVDLAAGRISRASCLTANEAADSSPAVSDGTQNGGA